MRKNNTAVAEAQNTSAAAEAAEFIGGITKMPKTPIAPAQEEQKKQEQKKQQAAPVQKFFVVANVVTVEKDAAGNIGAKALKHIVPAPKSIKTLEDVEALGKAVQGYILSWQAVDVNKVLADLAEAEAEGKTLTLAQEEAKIKAATRKASISALSAKYPVPETPNRTAQLIASIMLNRPLLLEVGATVSTMRAVLRLTEKKLSSLFNTGKAELTAEEQQTVTAAKDALRTPLAEYVPSGFKFGMNNATVAAIALDLRTRSSYSTTGTKSGYRASSFAASDKNSGALRMCITRTLYSRLTGEVIADDTTAAK